MKIVFVTYSFPDPDRSGGFHRTYQIQHELEHMPTSNQVQIFSARQWAGEQEKTRSYTKRMWNSLRHRSQRIKENPLRLLSPSRFSPQRFSGAQLVSKYEDLVNEMQPDVCLIDHAGFGDVIAINHRNRIPTIACVQNLQALEEARPNWTNRWFAHTTCFDFANELQTLHACEERLFISKVETGVVQGLGLSSRFYPYRPVGVISDRLLEIRRERRTQGTQTGLFLLVGSADHKSTGEAFRWLIQQVKTHGLPSGAKLVVVGRETDSLLPSGERIPNLELRGWVEQPILNQLMLQAQAVLVPQFRGFGALTRLAELPLAGIPVITSQYATYAVDMPPGVWVVEDQWHDWQRAISNILTGAEIADAELEAWYDRQTSPLEHVLETLG